MKKNHCIEQMFQKTITQYTISYFNLHVPPAELHDPFLQLLYIFFSLVYQWR